MSDRQSWFVLWLGLALMALACIALALLALYQVAAISPDLRESQAHVMRGFDVIRTGRLLERALRDAERSQRNFLITGDVAQHHAYASAARDVPTQLAALKESARAHEDLRRRIPELEERVRGLMADLELVSTAARAGRIEGARAMIRASLQADRISGITALLDDMIAAEDGRLVQRGELSAREERRLSRTAMAAGMLALALMAMGALVVLHAFGTLREAMSARRASEQKLEDARLELAQAQKMESLGQIAGGLAHDFNNLLTVIMGAIESALRRLEEGQGNVAATLQIAQSGANRAAGLTQRLLAFARRQPPQPVPLDPNQLVAGVVSLIQGSLGEGVAVEAALGEGVWRIRADANQLEIAILNLALNSRDAMPGGGKVAISTANAVLEKFAAGQEVPAGSYVLIAVSDNGAGIPPGLLDRVFEPFFTTKATGRGTGLGLSQVRGFARQSQGYVRIVSEPGAGTTVTLYLPRLDELRTAEEH